MTPEQARFIEDMRKQFGFRAHLNEIPVKVTLQDRMSSDDWFTFGYNGYPFQKRASPQSVYYTEYAKADYRQVYDLKQELMNTLGEIYESYRRFAICINNCYCSYAIRQACYQLGIPFTGILLQIEGLPRMNELDLIDIEEIKVPFSKFEEYTHKFCETVDTYDPLLAFRAMHGEYTDLPVVYTAPLPYLINHNYDVYDRKVCGPNNWGLCDSENQTRVSAWLIEQGRKGVADIWRYRPETLVAWFNSPLMQAYLADSNPQSSTQTFESRMYETNFDLPSVKTQILEIHSKNSSPAYNHLQAHCYLKRNKQRADVHYWPLPRWLERLGLPMQEHYGKYEQIYGAVS